MPNDQECVFSTTSLEGPLETRNELLNSIFVLCPPAANRISETVIMPFLSAAIEKRLNLSHGSIAYGRHWMREPFPSR